MLERVEICKKCDSACCTDVSKTSRFFWKNLAESRAVRKLPRGVRVNELSERTDSLAVTEITSLLQTIARALVDNTEEVRVETIFSPDSTVLRLFVSPQDIGKLIGKQGRTARSLRTILSAASMKLQSRFALDIVEAGRTEPVPPDAE
jgi:predicted RNA-binding protein YlqC (UPF0109 family)